jgi:hypothetical protein
MSHQCPFPVRATDTRRCYRTGSVPGFTFCLTLAAILLAYAGLSDAAPAENAPKSAAAAPASFGAAAGWVKRGLLVAPRPGQPDKELDKILKAQTAGA